MIPSIPLVFFLEDDLAQLGIDSFEFGGSTIRKIARLAERAGFELIVPFPVLFAFLNALFNSYCALTRESHETRDYFSADTTRGAALLGVEKEVLGALA